ncbi:MAG: hypothetical protein ABSH05_25240 [Bryobacteraceae bacterium]
MDFHEDFTRKEETAGPSDRIFCLALAAGLAGAGFWPLLARRPVRWWALAASLALAVVGLVRPFILSPVKQLLARVALAVSAVVSALVAALLFYLVVTPIGVFMRRQGRDPLGLRFDAGAASYWKQRDPPGPAPGTMPRQF